MVRKLFILFIASLYLSCDDVVSERGNGQIESQKRTFEDFKEIYLKGNYQITLKSGSKPQMVIVTDENLLEFIHSYVEDEVLTVENKQKIYSKDGIKLFITYRELEGIQSTQASVLKSDNPISGEKFSLEVTGAGLVELELDVQEFRLDLPGAGLVQLSGKVREANFNLAGVGNLEAYDLIADNCSVTVTGVGGAQVHVKENLNASVNGIGGISFKGDPRVVQQEVSGIGTIKKAKNGNSGQQEQEI